MTLKMLMLAGALVALAPAAALADTTVGNTNTNRPQGSSGTATVSSSTPSQTADDGSTVSGSLDETMTFQQCTKSAPIQTNGTYSTGNGSTTTGSTNHPFANPSTPLPQTPTHSAPPMPIGPFHH